MRVVAPLSAKAPAAVCYPRSPGSVGTIHPPSPAGSRCHPWFPPVSEETETLATVTQQGFVPRDAWCLMSYTPDMGEATAQASVVPTTLIA